MGRRSKATVAQLNNLMKPANPQNPTVEEVFDEEDADFEAKDFLEQVGSRAFFSWMKNTHLRMNQMALTAMMEK